MKSPHSQTQHKRFVSCDTHLDPSLTLKTSFMLRPLDKIATNICLEKKIDKPQLSKYS